MAELPIIRVPLEAATVEELTRIASERLRGEFFVPWEQPYPGGRVRVEATSETLQPQAAVRGVATVRAAVRDGRKGLMARLVNLDAESIRIPLGGLAPVVRVPTVVTPPPARAQKITRPVPLSGETIRVTEPPTDGDDFDDPTHASRVPEQVAQAMKPAAPREQRHVIRRNTPLAFPPVSRPATAPAVAPSAPKLPLRPAPLARPQLGSIRPGLDGDDLEPEIETEIEAEVEAEVEAEMPDLVIEEKSVPIDAPPLEPAPAASAAPRPKTEPVPVPSPAPAPASAPARPQVPAEVYAPPAPPKSMKPGQIALGDIARSGPSEKPRRGRRPFVIGAAIAAVAVAVLLIVVLPSGSSGGSPSALDDHIVLADKRMREGRLTGPGGDQALDHLLAARKLAPDDARVRDRLTALADTFEQLADGAIAAGDLAEAATHLQAAINAQPDRASAVTKLRDVEQRARH